MALEFCNIYAKLFCPFNKLLFFFVFTFQIAFKIKGTELYIWKFIAFTGIIYKTYIIAYSKTCNITVTGGKEFFYIFVIGFVIWFSTEIIFRISKLAVTLSRKQIPVKITFRIHNNIF